jgi:hypothetical protein
VIERFEIDLARNGARGDQRFDFRSEIDARSVLDEMQGLDAGAIAGKKQGPPGSIPERDAEHASQTGERALAPLFVGVNDRLGIARRVEAVSSRFEIAAEFAVVVDPPLNTARRRSHCGWLVARGQIDDAQPPHPESRPRLDMNPLVIRSAMADNFTHPVHQLEVRVGPGTC